MANRRFIDFPVATTVGAGDIILIWQDGLNKQTTKATILSGLPEDLEDLADVDISGLTNGQILRYNSTTGKWENTDQGNLDLADLNDVSIVSPANGQVLVYNSTTGKWENSSAGFVPYTGAVTTVNLGVQQIIAGSFAKTGGTAAQFLKADGSVDSTAYGTGTVTSVGLTMPAAFTVANSPVTGAGTIGVTGAGTTAQYIRGDGSLENFPSLTGFVPYTGANQTVNLNTQLLQAGHTTLTTNGSTETLTIAHTSGSGVGVNITKAGNNEGLRVNKTSGSGNAATIIGTLEATTLVKTGGTSAQFLKADGTVDSNVYALNSALASYQLLSAKGQPNGYAGLDGNGKVPLAQINDALLGNVNFQGLWNAATNTPTLANPPAAGTKGHYYIVSTAGTFAGIIFDIGDWIISSGTTWDKVDNTDAVSSVFGRTGNVSATSGDYNTSQVTENTNLYFTNARAIASVLTGYTSGAGTISAADSILAAIQKLNGNIGALTTGVSSVNGQTGVVTLTTTNIAEGTNLYYTEARVNANTNVAANTAARHAAVTLGTANGLSLATQQLSLGLASAGVTGALSGTDWSTFNNKQAQLNGTGFVKISGTTISYDNSTYYLASNPSAFIALTALSAGAGISYNNTTGVITSTITQYTDALARAALSFVAGSGAYNSSTGVITIPTNNNQIANGANYITAAALGAYLPLVGGTLTGTLGGTSAVFSGNVQANAFTSSNDGLSVGGYNFYSQTISGAMGILGHNLRASNSVANQVNVVNGGWISSMIRQYFSDGISFHTSSTSYSAGAIYPMSATEQMRINLAGNVLIGTIADNSNKLRVTGTAWFDNSITGASFIRNGGTSSQFLKADGSIDSSTYITGNQTITLSGVVTGSGTTAITTAIANGAITNAMLANSSFFVGTTSIALGRASAAQTLTDVSIDGNAATANTWTTARTITIGNTGKSVNGSANVAWSLAEIGAYAATNPSVFIALTALSGVAPIQYNNTTGAISITQASSSANGFLSSTDWTTFNNKTSNVGTVTSVAALTLGTSGTDLSSSVANGTTTPVITLNVPTASAANRGALSAADWTTFNNKQNALTNPVTGTGTTNYLPKFTGASTIGNSAIFDNGTNVGIGTTNPLSLLHVRGSSSGAVQSMIHNTDGATNSSAELVFGTWSGAIPTGSGNPGPSAKIVALNVSASSAATDLIFHTYSSGGISAERFRISSTGAATFSSSVTATNGVFSSVVNVNNASSVEALNVNGNIMLQGTANRYIRLQSATNYYYNLSSVNDDFQIIEAGSIPRLTIRYPNGNVGIGTTSPSELLQISKTQSATTRLQITNAQTGTSLTIRSSVRVTANDRTGEMVAVNGDHIYVGSTTNHNTNIMANGGAVLTATPTGNVGIGTATPVLENGGGQVIFNSTVPRLAFRNSTSGTTSLDGTDLALVSSDFFIFNRESGSVILGTSGLERMRIFSGGNVHIGPTPSSDNGARLQVNGTTSLTGALNGTSAAFTGGVNLATSSGNVGIGIAAPSRKLDVNGTAQIGNLTTTSLDTSLILKGMAVSDGSGIFGDYAGLVMFANPNFTAAARRYLITNSLDANKFGIIRSVDALTTPTLGVNGAVSSGIADFVITNSGNVGIGTTSPTNGRLEIQQSTTTAALWAQTGGTTASHIIADFRTGTNLPALQILGNGNSIFEGNVGIGTNAPSSLLHVRGNGEVYFERNNNTFNPALRIQKSRGTASSRTIVANGDFTGSLTLEAFNGTLYSEATGIMGIVNGTVSSGVTPTDLILSAGASGTTSANERMRIHSGGNVRIGSSAFGDSGDVLRVGGNIFTNTITTLRPDNNNKSVAYRWGIVYNFTNPGPVNKSIRVDIGGVEYYISAAEV